MGSNVFFVWAVFNDFNSVLCVCSRVGGLATFPSWIPSPLESGSSCFWPTWLSAASSFWWPGRELTSKIRFILEREKLLKRQLQGQSTQWKHKKVYQGFFRRRKQMSVLYSLQSFYLIFPIIVKEMFSSLWWVSNVTVTPAGQAGNWHNCCSNHFCLYNKKHYHITL